MWKLRFWGFPFWGNCDLGESHFGCKKFPLQSHNLPTWQHCDGPARSHGPVHVCANADVEKIFTNQMDQNNSDNRECRENWGESFSQRLLIKKRLSPPLSQSLQNARLHYKKWSLERCEINFAKVILTSQVTKKYPKIILNPRLLIKRLVWGDVQGPILQK